MPTKEIKPRKNKRILARVNDTKPSMKALEEVTETPDLAKVITGGNRTKLFKGVAGAKLKAKIIRLVRAGAMLQDVVKLTGASPFLIKQLMMQYDLSIKRVKDFEEMKVDLICDLQRKLIFGITDENIQKATMNQKILGLVSLVEKQRLLEDKSTDNIATLHQDIAAIKNGMKLVNGSVVETD